MLEATSVRDRRRGRPGRCRSRKRCVVTVVTVRGLGCGSNELAAMQSKVLSMIMSILHLISC